MLLRKSKNSHFTAKERTCGSQVARVKVTAALLVLSCFIVTLLCWSAGRSVPAKPTSVGIDKSQPAEPNVSEAPGSLADVAEAACELICQGKFDAAGELIRQSYEGYPSEVSRAVDQLLEIIGEYQAVTRQRQSARETAYKEQLAELEKRRVAMDTNDVNDLTATADANDANDITEALSVIVNASEFANDAQRTELLSNPFVKRVFQSAIDRAAGFELEGKWLDAYTICYVWLHTIDPNNEAYSDYADELLDKAGIVASFEDSPCETRQERFQGIKKEMFIRAIDALNLHYISIIDYSEMASEALKRCELLAEVMATSFSRNLLAESPESSFSPPDTIELAAWSVALAALSDEVDHLPTGFIKDEFIELFERVLALNAATVELPPSVLIAHFAEAALSALDPYTVMVWPRQVQDFEKMMTNEFTGIGVEISKPKGLLTVSSLLPDTPAHKAGLDAGDVIVAVDGVETKDMSLICAVHKITGPKGTKVTLTIKGPDEEKTRDVTITRAKITVPTIRGWRRTEAGGWLYMIDELNKIGYIRLTSFSAETPSRFEEMLDLLEEEGLKGLILDLRFNTGGLLESAVDVADKFIEDGLIVRTQPGFGRTPTYKPAHKTGTHPDYPLVILINAGSASASEIVAGALADEMHKRAVLVGERTHGKGSVQGITDHPGGGARLKYTMSYYHLPSGQRVQSRETMEKQGRKDWGVGPNIELELTSDELRKMLGVQRDNDVLVQADRDEDRASPEKHTVEETLAADPQLAVGVLVVKAKLAQAGALVSKAKELPAVETISKKSPVRQAQKDL